MVLSRREAKYPLHSLEGAKMNICITSNGGQQSLSRQAKSLAGVLRVRARNLHWQQCSEWINLIRTSVHQDASFLIRQHQFAKIMTIKVLFNCMECSSPMLRSIQGITLLWDSVLCKTQGGR